MQVSSLLNTSRTNDSQSPVNINKPFINRENPLPIVLNYEKPEVNLQLRNDGLKLIFQAENFGSMSDGNHVYKAKEIHIHHPSEHTVTYLLTLYYFNSLETMNQEL